MLLKEYRYYEAPLSPCCLWRASPPNGTQPTVPCIPFCCSSTAYLPVLSLATDIFRTLVSIFSFWNSCSWKHQAVKTYGDWKQSSHEVLLLDGSEKFHTSSQSRKPKETTAWDLLLLGARDKEINFYFNCIVLKALIAVEILRYC